MRRLPTTPASLSKPYRPKVKPDEERWPQLEHDIVRLRRRLNEVVVIDFFGAPGREVASGLVLGIEARIRGNKAAAPSQTRTDREN
jgi:hypothetical protein